MAKRTENESLLRGVPAWVTALVLLPAGLVLSLLAAVTIGSTDIPLTDVYHVILYQFFGIGGPTYGEGNLFRAVWYLRLPRLLLAAGIGMSLAVCGVIMQAVVKNPLVNMGSRASSVKLLLAGMAVSSVCSAFSNFIVYTANDREGMQTVTCWMMGGLAGATWEQDAAVLLVALLGAGFFWTQHRNLNLMLLGDESAIALGTDH